MARTKGSKNKKEPGVLITHLISKESKEWLKQQPESYGKTIDKLIKGKINET